MAQGWLGVLALVGGCPRTRGQSGHPGWVLPPRAHTCRRHLASPGASIRQHGGGALDSKTFPTIVDIHIFLFSQLHLSGASNIRMKTLQGRVLEQSREGPLGSLLWPLGPGLTPAMHTQGGTTSQRLQGKLSCACSLTPPSRPGKAFFSVIFPSLVHFGNALWAIFKFVMFPTAFSGLSLIQPHGMFISISRAECPEDSLSPF